MNPKLIAKIGAAVIALVSLTACGNTIRGMGRDTANAVNATQSAGSDVVNAAR